MKINSLLRRTTIADADAIANVYLRSRDEDIELINHWCSANANMALMDTHPPVQ